MSGREGYGLIRTMALCAVACVWCVCRAADDTMSGVFHPDFRTLRVRLASNPYAPPVVALNDENDKVEISFDELSESRRYMRYSLTHCDAFWRPEGLVESEFLDGFNEGVVEDYAFSESTLVHYVHYSISLPNGQMRITQPGNYLLRVYDESEPDVTLLQARFGVADFSAAVSTDISTATDVDYNGRHQQVAFKVDTEHLALDDPFSDLKVTVSQNGRSDNEVVLSAPQRVRGKELVYEHLRPLIFPAGNEYRRFETVSTTYPGMGVERIVYAEPYAYDNPYYNMELRVDLPRSDTGYEYDRTQHGRYTVRSVEADDSDTGADYVMVHFALAMPELAGKELFLDGDLVNRRFDPSSRMKYNRSTGRYENDMLLKQGAYNYQYLSVPSGASTGSTLDVEGDYFRTDNEYTVKVYHRPRGTRFDRLVGVSQVSLGEINSY